MLLFEFHKGFDDEFCLILTKNSIGKSSRFYNQILIVINLSLVPEHATPIYKGKGAKYHLAPFLTFRYHAYLSSVTVFKFLSTSTGAWIISSCFFLNTYWF